jgi:hypothetical protein
MSVGTNVKTAAFVDTNTFLHFRPIPELEWLRILGSNEVTIIIVPIIIRQLDTQKDMNDRKAIRRRAASRLTWIRELLRIGRHTAIREGVSVRLEPREPELDLPAYHLSRAVDDDLLLASIIEYRERHPAERVVLVTADIGLMVKASHHNVEVVELLKDARLPEEVDPDEARIRELEQQVRELESSRPDLRLRFADGPERGTFRLPRPVSASAEEIDRRMAAIRRRYPKLGEQPQATEANSALYLLIATYQNPMTRLSSEQISSYDKALDNYFEKYRQFLPRLIEFENESARIIEINVGLENRGTALAEDIDILLKFPNGFKLLTEALEPPRGPSPPEKPKPFLERMGSLGDFRVPAMDRLRDIGPPPNVSSPRIRRSNSYDVEVHVGRIKHGWFEPFDPLYVLFESIDAARSFHFDYRINAANLPKDTKGVLHVIIEAAT